MTFPSDPDVERSAQKFEAMLKSARLTAAGWTITFQVHPDEIPSEILMGQSRPGARFYVVAVPIGDDELPAAPSQQEIEEPSSKPTATRTLHGVDVVSLAGQVCRNKSFQEWIIRLGTNRSLDSSSNPTTEENAANLMRLVLSVESRRELATDQVARERFYRLIHKWRTEADDFKGLDLE